MKTLTIPEIKNALRESLLKRKAFYLTGGRGSGKSTMLSETFKEVLEELAIEKARENGKTY